MVVSTAGSFKLVHSDGGRGGGRLELTGVKNGMKAKRNKSNKKNLQSDDLPYTADTSRIQTSQKPKLKIKKKLKKTFPNKAQRNIFFISYIQLNSNVNSSTRSIYFFIIILRYLLYFSQYLQLYRQKHTLQSAQIEYSID